VTEKASGPPRTKRDRTVRNRAKTKNLSRGGGKISSKKSKNWEKEDVMSERSVEIRPRLKPRARGGGGKLQLKKGKLRRKKKNKDQWKN